MKISQLLADDAILVEIGKRITRRRLDLQLTQADVAEQAGIGKRTVERIEAGASAQLLSIIRIFRVLDLLAELERLIPEIQPRPMELLKYKEKTRQRASPQQIAEQPEKPWIWDDET